MRLKDRVIVVTGGARGIGGATSTLCAREGARVVIGDLLEPEGKATVAAIEREGGQAIFVRTDVTREADCAALMSAAVEAYGRLDVLICCAGILKGAFVPVEELDEATFEQVMDVNVKGDFLAVKHAVPFMRRAGSGVVILIASGAGVRGGSSSVAYGTSKGGVHGMAMVLEEKLAPLGIRVNDVCPGAVNTPLKRENVADAARAAGRPVDEALAAANLVDPMGIAQVLAFLASPEADMVKGSIFTR